jgi:predicted MFS family arabinose efflux permease
MAEPAAVAAPLIPSRDLPRGAVVGLMGFLTLVDHFAAQAILPMLASTYAVPPSAAGLAVNAGTLGMAISGLAVSLFAARLDRRRGIAVSLALLSIPTALLAVAPDLATFAFLRATQGVFMAAAFTLTMTYLAERGGPNDTAAALAAYVTGVVASNLVGRLLSSAVADAFGLSANFAVFAALNLAGAALVALTLKPSMRMAPGCRPPQAPLAAWRQHLSTPGLKPAFGLGFIILFVFIGTFTYVNFELVRAPLMLSSLELGLVYFVFTPALVTTPLAGRAARRIGTRAAVIGSLAVALLALPLLLAASLPAILGGLVLMGVGTFFAQAAATGYVGRTATSDRAAASGMYLTSYYCGGLAGAFVFGEVYDRAGWETCIAGFGLALLAGIALATLMRDRR